MSNRFGPLGYGHTMGHIEKYLWMKSAVSVIEPDFIVCNTVTHLFHCELHYTLKYGELES